MARSSKSNTTKIIFVLVAVLFVGLNASTVYLFTENRDLKDQLTLTTEEKNRRIVEEINQVFDLPDGEDPVVAIVTNKDEFKTEYPSFDNAETGDYLLFYRKARLNVLYRQSDKKVVKTANVTVPITVELVGTTQAIADAEKKLADFGTQISVVKTVKDGVTQSFVYDIDDDQKPESESIATQLGIDIGTTLPSSITPGDQTEVIIAVAGGSLSSVEDTTPSAQTQP